MLRVIKIGDDILLTDGAEQKAFIACPSRNNALKDAAVFANAYDLKTQLGHMCLLLDVASCYMPDNAKQAYKDAIIEARRVLRAASNVEELDITDANRELCSE